MAKKKNPRKSEKLVYKEQDFQSYILWKSLPDILYGKDEKTLEALGITDEVTKELLKIKTQVQFKEKYKLHADTLTDWNKKIVENDLLINPKEIFKKKVKNVLLSLYRNALINGNAGESKLFFQYVDDWEEKSKTTHIVDLEAIKELTKITKELLRK
jgi:hypothetical protein